MCFSRNVRHLLMWKKSISKILYHFCLSIPKYYIRHHTINSFERKREMRITGAEISTCEIIFQRFPCIYEKWCEQKHTWRWLLAQCSFNSYNSVWLKREPHLFPYVIRNEKYLFGLKLYAKDENNNKQHLSIFFLSKGHVKRQRWWNPRAETCHIHEISPKLFIVCGIVKTKLFLSAFVARVWLQRNQTARFE